MILDADEEARICKYRKSTVCSNINKDYLAAYEYANLKHKQGMHFLWATTMSKHTSKDALSLFSNFFMNRSITKISFSIRKSIHCSE